MAKVRKDSQMNERVIRIEQRLLDSYKRKARGDSEERLAEKLGPGFVIRSRDEESRNSVEERRSKTNL